MHGITAGTLLKNEIHNYLIYKVMRISFLQTAKPFAPLCS